MGNNMNVIFRNDNRPDICIWHQWFDERLFRQCLRGCIRDHVRYDGIPEAYVAKRYNVESVEHRIRRKTSDDPGVLKSPNFRLVPAEKTPTMIVHTFPNWNKAAGRIVDIVIDWPDGRQEAFTDHEYKKRNP